MASTVTKTRARSGLILPRFGTPRDLSRVSLGAGVAEIANQLGMPLMPWQRHVVDVALEVDPKNGQLWYRQVVLAVPRQNGKTSLGMAVKTHRCTRFGAAQNVLYLAQTRDESRQKFVEEHEPILAGVEMFAKSYTRRLSNGSEHIRWLNGSRWGIVAPNRKAGHGKTVDLAELDEAFSHADNRVEQALRPSMITRSSRQLWVVSTAGDAESFYWWGKVSAGRAACEKGRHGRTAFFEWSAPDDADPADEAVWRATIPALGHTITVQSIREEWENALRDGPEAVNLFRRAFLNQWPEVPQMNTDPVKLWQVISEAAWHAVSAPEAVPDRSVPLCFGVDVTPDRGWSSIGVAGRSAGGAEYVESVDHRPGTGWLVDRVTDLDGRYQPVWWALDPAGPAGAFADDIRAVVGDRLLVATARDHAQAAGGFHAAVTNRVLVHRGVEELDAAVAAAVSRPLGEAWGWARSGPSPVSPLVAVTLARWASKRPGKKRAAVFAY